MTTGSVPRHVPGVVLITHPGGAQLVRSAQRVAVDLDATALALWELCDGETTVDEMTLAAASLFDAPPATVERDIGAALQALVDAGALEWAPQQQSPSSVGGSTVPGGSA